MKIYCVLVDSVPYSKRIQDYAENRTLDLRRQFSHCFTKTSVCSLLTGQLPSDLEEGGIGWKTHSKYRLFPVNAELNEEVVQWPWIDKTITSQMINSDWEVHVHNGNFFNQIITNNPKFSKTTAYLGGLKEEMSGTWGSADFIFADHPNYPEYYEAEKDFISNLQKKKSEKNSFHFIMLHQYHTAIGSNKDLSVAEDSIYEILDLWDFEEEDCLFYFFSDHGDYSKCKNIPGLNIFYTWAIIKDTTKNPLKIDLPLAIYDFYKMCEQKLGSKNTKDIEAAINDKNRVYFMEDSRATVDLMRTSFYSATRFSEWNERVPKKLNQVFYYRPSKTFKAIQYDFETLKIKTIEDLSLKKSLVKKFNLGENK